MKFLALLMASLSIAAVASPCARAFPAPCGRYLSPGPGLFGPGGPVGLVGGPCNPDYGRSPASPPPGFRPGWTPYPDRGPGYFGDGGPRYFPQEQPRYYPDQQPRYYPDQQPRYYPQQQPRYYPQQQPRYYPQQQPRYYPDQQPRYYPQPLPIAPRYNPPQISGLCQGDFSGTLDNGETIDMSITSSGQNVMAKVTGSQPGDTYSARGTCQESKGVAHLTLKIDNGASTSAKIYVANDGTVTLDGSQNGEGQGFILQKR
jgi:hypothetical protein